MEFTGIKTGMTNEVTTFVDETNTAIAMGSGTLAVFATPAMTALMEKAAAELLEKHMPDGWTTVGTALNIAHKSATPTGLNVRAVAKVTAIEGRKFTFEVTAYDDSGEIGDGSHERFAVSKDKFLKKAQEKRG